MFKDGNFVEDEDEEFGSHDMITVKSSSLLELRNKDSFS